MARYPDLPRPNTGYAFRSNWPTVVGGPEWAQQSRALTRFNLAEADLSYTAKTWEQIRILYEFFESVNGSAGRFTFVDFNGIGPIGGTDPGVAWSHLFVAKGDGIATSWDLPTYAIKSFWFRNEDGDPVATLAEENGASVITEFGTTTPAAGHYGVSVGTGTDGVDKLYAGTTPTAGVIISISATCRRAMRRAKFATVKCPFVFGVPAIYQAGTLSVVEVRK